MKTVYILNDEKKTEKRYLTKDGTVFEIREMAVQHEKRMKLIASIKEKYNTVFSNGDEVANSIIDGLQRMLEYDRRMVLNGLLYLTTERKSKKASV